MKEVDQCFLATKIVRYAVLLLIIFYTACGSTNDSSKKEAYAYCEIYNFDNWDFSKYPDAWALQIELSKRIKSTVTSKEITQMLDNFASDHSQLDFHAYMETELSKLIGEKWACPAHKKFYSRSNAQTSGETTTTIVTDQSSAPANENEVVVWIDKDGNYYINSSDTAISDSFSLKESLSKQKYQRVIIRADGRTQHQYVVTLIDVAKALRIPEISIETKS